MRKLRNVNIKMRNKRKFIKEDIILLYERINLLCKENGITGKELGEKLGLKKSPLTDWKNKKSKPTIDQIITICEIFAVSANYLLFGKEINNLTQEEQKIIDAYRQADPAEQNIIRKILDIPENIEKSSNSKIG